MILRHNFGKYSVFCKYCNLDAFKIATEGKDMNNPTHVKNVAKLIGNEIFYEKLNDTHPCITEEELIIKGII